MDVEDWLRQLGLGQYATAFTQNAVTMDLLPTLTADDLKDLGVAAIGHRRRLLNAVARLSTAAAGGEHASEPQAATPDAAERRQLTVMFCDISGSTPLSIRLDPEDLSAVIRSYQTCVQSTIRRFGGFIARYVGDGVLIYFGWPEAHEADPERAVLGALAVIAAISQTPMHGERLSIRIGIATGLVVVGAPIGEGEAWQQTAIGETPNLAARLQALAAPNGIVIAESTRRQVGKLFALDDLGLQTLAGFATPQRVWRVLGESDQGNRFEALRTNIAPLIGRDEELDLLLRRWAQAVSGEGQLVLIEGEPGIGKSRLVASLQERHQLEGHVRLTYFCSPQRTDTALYPIVGQLERAAAIDRDEAPASQCNKLDQLLLAVETSEEDRVLIAALLGLDYVDGRYPSLQYTPQVRKQKTLDALVRQLEALAARQPVLMLFEDAHWSDPTSFELLDRTVEQIRRLPVLLVVTFRPEFTAPWVAQPHVTKVVLRRLDARESARLAAHLDEDRVLQNELLEEIISRSDGVPLFLEELTKAVLEAPSAEEGIVRAVLPSSTAIPATLYASLTARLDRLGPSKDVAQVGAVVGREFPYGLVRELCPLTQERLHSALAHLVASGLVRQRGVPPAATYQFKHALVQQAAYEMLLRSDRRSLHARLASLLENSSETAERQPEVLAHHFAAADLNDKALRYWTKAGARSVERSTMREAEGQFKKALAQLAYRPDSRERQCEELLLQARLGATRFAIRGWAATETGQAYDRAQELWEQLGYPPGCLNVPWGQWMYHTNRGELDFGRHMAEDWLHHSQERADLRGMTLAHLCLGASLMMNAELQSAQSHFREVNGLSEAHDTGSFIQLAGVHVHAMNLTFLALVDFCLGYPDQAFTAIDTAILATHNQRHSPSIAHSLAMKARLLYFIGDAKLVGECADALLTIATDQGFPYWRAQGLIFTGWAKSTAGDTDDGISSIRDGIEAYYQTGACTWTPLFHAMEAEAEALCGHSEVALGILDHALQTSRARHENWLSAELVRRYGELFRNRDPSNAEALFREALETARFQRAKLWELRAAVSLSSLWARAGRRDAARDLISSVYGWFTEGFGTPDLREARALLDEVGT